MITERIVEGMLILRCSNHTFAESSHPISELRKEKNLINLCDCQKCKENICYLVPYTNKAIKKSKSQILPIICPTGKK